MSGEPFDSGAVLSRARPVLTFSTAVRTEGSVAGADAAAKRARPRIDTPTPGGVSWHDPVAVIARPRGSDLPVIARIVRDGPLDRGALGTLAARARTAGAALRRSGIGALVVGALGLATLGAIAGLGMRSLSDEAAIASGSPAGASRSFDATATERLLARAALADRVDRGVLSTTEVAPPSAPAPAATHAPAFAPAHASTPALAHAHPLTPTPSAHSSAHAPAKVPARAPSHPAPRAFAAAHAAHASARHASSTSAIARR